MPIQTKIITDAVVSAAKGVAKIALGELLDSVKGKNQGQIVSFKAEGNENIICFVHGFCGDPQETFNPIPEFIIKEEQLQGWDVISVGYATDLMPNIGKGIWAAKPDLAKVAEYLKTYLEILSKNYKRIAIIGHSMGGLVIQKTILQLPNYHALSHILFFGTPSGGLKKAWFARWFNNHIRDMDNEGEFIKTLRSDWDKKFEKTKYPFYFRTVAGELDEFVPTKSSLDPFDQEYRSYTTGNHITMVKPESTSDASFQIIKASLTNDSTFLKNYDYQALNNLVGTYHHTIKSLEERITKLDTNGLKNYIFALEGTGNIDKAIEVIEKSEMLMSNTDLMGILGGRYKRKYLWEDEKQFLEKALFWYNKAYDISLSKNNPGQVYYHSINLAFLYLLLDATDKSKTKQYAQIAIDNCNAANDGDCWDAATRAEAYLYLNNWEESKKHYQKAVRLCNKQIRELNSIMMNATYAASALNRFDLRPELEQMFSTL